MKNSLLDCKSLSKNDVKTIINQASIYKKADSEGVLTPEFKGRTSFNLFLEPSTRTRSSFETAAKRLGIMPINIYGNFSSIKKGETLNDTILTLSKMHPALFVIRHTASGICRQLSNITNIPIVNAGDGTHAHPSQALLDLFTIIEKKGTAKGLNISIIGDISSSRVARSDSELLIKMGCNVTFYAPPTMLPYQYLQNVTVAKDMKEALRNKDAVILLRIQLERKSGNKFLSLKEYSKYFGLHKNMLADKTLILHPGPFNRGVEISSNLLKQNNIVIFDQVENGVYVRMAIFRWLLEEDFKLKAKNNL